MVVGVCARPEANRYRGNGWVGAAPKPLYPLPFLPLVSLWNART